LLKSTAKPRDAEPDKTPPAWTTQTTTPIAKPSPAPRPADETEPAPKADPREPLLAVLREMTKENLYQTYLNIGQLADSLEQERCPLLVAEDLLEGFHTIIDREEVHLKEIPPSAFKTDEDRNDMELARSLLPLLRTLTNELQGHCDVLKIALMTSTIAPMTRAPEVSALWVSRDREHSVRFQKARAETWAGIKKLLRIRE
jgi:hypothetical protein